jgi:hypothetical protein
VQAILDKHKPGDTITIEAEQRGVKKTVQLTFTEDPQVEVVAFESINKEVTPEMKKLRVEWLGSLVNRVTTSKDAKPWEFGIGALMQNLASRGLLEKTA